MKIKVAAAAVLAIAALTLLPPGESVKRAYSIDNVVFCTALGIDSGDGENSGGKISISALIESGSKEYEVLEGTGGDFASAFRDAEKKYAKRIISGSVKVYIVSDRVSETEKKNICDHLIRNNQMSISGYLVFTENDPDEILKRKYDINGDSPAKTIIDLIETGGAAKDARVLRYIESFYNENPHENKYIRLVQGERDENDNGNNKKDKEYITLDDK